MKERPILFAGEMVRALLDGRKTQTRRPVKNQKHPYGTWATPEEVAAEFIGGTCAFVPPLGTVGEKLWVRETWGLMAYHDTTDWCRDSICQMTQFDIQERWSVEHAANWDLPHEPAYWRPSIHMPRWASRITLEITAVRVERVQDITEEDAKAEGIAESEIARLAVRVLKNYRMQTRAPVILQFADLWQSIYGTWDANPWVWVYEFRRVKP